MLMEGAIFNYDKEAGHGAVFGSRIPPGTGGLESERDTISLYAYHKPQLAERKDMADHIPPQAVAEAERDYETFKRRPPAYIDPDSDQNKADRDEAILRWSGKRAEWVAVMEGCSKEHVRKLRKLHKLNPIDGERLEHVG